MCNKARYFGDDEVKITITKSKCGKCACRITARDIPPGLEPEDVALECEDDPECPKNRKKRRGKPMTLARKLERMAAWGNRSRVACVHRLKPGIVPPTVNPDDVTLDCREDPYCPKRRGKREIRISVTQQFRDMGFSIMGVTVAESDVRRAFKKKMTRETRRKLRNILRRIKRAKTAR